MAISEIHIIHHPHVDLGYTDLPSTTLDFLGSYVRDAIHIAERTATFPEEARLHWTCEVACQAESFLKTATAREKTSFGDLVDSGRFELGAMPFNITPLLSEAEWDAIADRLRPLYERYHPRTCFQNDINGLPWGLIPKFILEGVDNVMIGSNEYSGGSPFPVPSAFWWEGPQGERILTWVGYHYCKAYNFFYEGEWRRGPVPSYSDIWFNPPRGREIFNDSPSALRLAKKHLDVKLVQDLPDYPHEVLALQFTNMWRMDNDPPSEQICHFVRAWNDAGYSPRLRLSTPSLFMDALREEVGPKLRIHRGDWTNWWADGPASMPFETSIAQESKRRLADLRSGADFLSSKADIAALSSSAWNNTEMYTEHTATGWDSLAQPYKVLNLGGVAQKSDYAYRADEESRVAQALLLRKSSLYKPFSRTAHVAVFNPGEQTRSGWAEISAQALRIKANAAKDVLSGELFPFETTVAPNWSAPDEKAVRPFEVPDDIFSFQPHKLRFRCAAVKKGELRRFELVQDDSVTQGQTFKSAGAEGKNAHFSWSWENTPEAAGRERTPSINLADGSPLADSSSPWSLGEIIVEKATGFGARQKLLNRSLDSFSYEKPQAISWQAEPSAYGALYLRTWNHPSCRQIQQSWFFPATEPRIETVTTFWLRENFEPLGFYLAFPFTLTDSEARYWSLGVRTRVGYDQMAGACGEFACVGEGVEFVNRRRSIALSTIDTPLVCFESLATRSGRTTFVPGSASCFSIVSQNYWVTNFPHTRPAKLTVRHIIQTGAAGRDSVNTPASLNDQLITFPIGGVK